MPGTYIFIGISLLVVIYESVRFFRANRKPDAEIVISHCPCGCGQKLMMVKGEKPPQCIKSWARPYGDDQ